jgi:hypothetical protein
VFETGAGVSGVALFRTATPPIDWRVRRDNLPVDPGSDVCTGRSVRYVEGRVQEEGPAGGCRRGAGVARPGGCGRGTGVGGGGVVRGVGGCGAAAGSCGVGQWWVGD